AVPERVSRSSERRVREAHPQAPAEAARARRLLRAFARSARARRARASQVRCRRTTASPHSAAAVRGVQVMSQVLDALSRRILVGPLGREMARFGTPLALGMGLQTAFNLVDAYLIGHLGSEVAGPALGAIGICDQLAALG